MRRIHTISRALLGVAAGALVGAWLSVSSAQAQPRPRGEGMVSRLTERLDLSEEQAEKVRGIMESQRTTYRCWEKTTEEERRACREEAREAGDKQMMSVLSEEQFAEYKKIKAEREQRRSERWGGGHGRGRHDRPWGPPPEAGAR